MWPILLHISKHRGCLHGVELFLLDMHALFHINDNHDFEVDDFLD